MASRQEQGEQSRRALIDAAAAEFRRSGYAGAGVDAIAARAGLTSGSFYRHFASKNEIFAVVVAEGLDHIASNIRQVQGDGQVRWEREFIDFYFGTPYREEVESGCVLPSLAAEIARADERARAAFARGLDTAAGEFASRLSSLPKDLAQGRALSILAVMTGAVTLARAVGPGAMADEIAAAAAGTVLHLLIDPVPMPAPMSAALLAAPREHG